MLFILGVISFLQMAFIPGFIFFKYSRFTLEGKLQALVYIFAGSLIINYLLVYFLTSMRIYKPVTVYIVLLIEMVLLVSLWRKSGKTHLSLDVKAAFDSCRKHFESKTIFYNMVLVLSIAVIGIFFYFLISRVKEIFYHNDAVLSWNRFALDWFHNRLPAITYYYPQLIPANWSLTYIIMQNSDLQLVARNIMSLFPIGISILFLDMGLKKKNGVYFLGLIFFGGIILYLYEPHYITSGYVDIAVTFFAFLSFYVFYLGKDKRFDIKLSLLSVIFASGAAVTKQAGIYILVIILIWNFRLIYGNRNSLSKKTIVKTVVVIFLIIILIVLSWYFDRAMRIEAGKENDGIKMVQNVHGNRNSLERWDYGFKRILNANGKNNNTAKFLVYLFLFSLFLSLFHKKTRHIMLFIVIPITLLWGFFFSYDYRNLTIAFPFMAVCAAVGSHWFAVKLSEILQNLPRYKISIWHLGLFVILLMAVLNFTMLRKDALINNQIIQLQKIGDEGLNKKLYEHYKEHGFQGKVFSKYQFFRFLPVLRDYWAAEMGDKEVYYILQMFPRRPKGRLREIIKKIESGEYKNLFTYKGFKFIKIK